MNNKYNLTPKVIQDKYKVNDFNKLIELAKESTRVVDLKLGSTSIFIYNDAYNEIIFSCEAFKYNGDTEFKFDIVFYENKNIEIVFYNNSGEIEPEITYFDETDNKDENKFKEKILAIFEYLIDNKLIVLG